MRWVSSLSAFAVVLTGAALARAADHQKANDGFRELMQVSGDAPAHPERFPAELVKDRPDWSDEKTAAWRADLVARFAKAEVKGARENKAKAFLPALLGGDAYDVPLAWKGSAWVLAAPEPYVVGGPLFTHANGADPLHVRLTVYATAGAFPASAYSFAYAGAPMSDCKNRFDLCLEKHGVLNLNRGEAFIVGKGPLMKASEIPIETEWTSNLARLGSGQVIVVHCRRRGFYDFYARLVLTAVSAEGLEFDWNLLSLGFGAPADIRMPLKASDGNGADDLPTLAPG